jgi:hypothetical protein
MSDFGYEFWWLMSAVIPRAASPPIPTHANKVAGGRQSPPVPAVLKRIQSAHHGTPAPLHPSSSVIPPYTGPSLHSIQIPAQQLLADHPLSHQESFQSRQIAHERQQQMQEASETRAVLEQLAAIQRVDLIF